MARSEAKRTALLVPMDNANNATAVEGIDVYPVSALYQAAKSPNPKCSEIFVS